MDCATGLAVGSHGGYFYSCSRDKSIRRWDTRSLECDSHVPRAHGDWVSSVAVSPSEACVFSGGRDGVVKVWDADLHCKDFLLGHRGPISALLTSGRYLFSASHDKTVRVWQVEQFEH